MPVYPFEILALGYVLLLAMGVLVTRRQGAARVTMAGIAFAAGIFAAAAVLPEAARLWLGHLYLAAGYWIPALAAAPARDTRFERWLVATDARWQRLLDAAPTWLAHAGEVGYLLCYPLVPAAFLFVWSTGAIADVTRFWLAVLLAGFACYGSLPWLVARPPRLIRTAERTHRVARLNTAVLSRVSHNLTTFPSGHVAVSVAAALGVATLSPPAALALAMVAAAISIGAVAGRYHYAVDVVTGFIVGVAAAVVASTVVPGTRAVTVVEATAPQGRGDNSSDERRRLEMVERQLVSRGVMDRRVLDAMRKVPRERFVPRELAWRAYDDSALPIGLRQTISQPYIVAHMSELLRTAPQHRVLEIGTGSGYQAAVLGELVREVYTIEIVAELARRATATLQELGYRNVQVRSGDGYGGWPERAPFDRILITAAPEAIPQPLLDQLAPGGVLVAPVGAAGTTQWIVVAEKTERGIVQRRTIPVQFVPFTRQ